MDPLGWVPNPYDLGPDEPCCRGCDCGSGDDAEATPFPAETVTPFCPGCGRTDRIEGSRCLNCDWETEGAFPCFEEAASEDLLMVNDCDIYSVLAAYREWLKEE